LIHATIVENEGRKLDVKEGWDVDADNDEEIEFKDDALLPEDAETEVEVELEVAAFRICTSEGRLDMIFVQEMNKISNLSRI
jgi:hypothetical protein